MSSPGPSTPTTEPLPDTPTSEISLTYFPSDQDVDKSLENALLSLYTNTKPDRRILAETRDVVFSTYFCGFEKEQIISWADDMEGNQKYLVRAFRPGLDKSPLTPYA